MNNALTAKLANNGNGVIDAYGGIPFPIVKNGLEAIWNHILRWRAYYGVRKTAAASVQRNGDYTKIVTKEEILFNYYTTVNAKNLGNTIFYYLSSIKAPARLAGGVLLVHETLNQSTHDGGQPRKAWSYNTGRRNVRRAPSVGFDSPVASAEGLYTVDEIDIYNGSPERYNWNLLGKKEVYIPYNNYLLDSDQLKYDSILQKGHINPAFTRYELHRVWVVEATLKGGQHHIYAKRTFYIDEDSWSIVVLDQYNSKGELWRVSMSYLKNYYDLPSTLPVLEVYHDLIARRYHAKGLANEEISTMDFSLAKPDKKYFLPATLRRRGRR